MRYLIGLYRARLGLALLTGYDFAKSSFLVALPYREWCSSCSSIWLRLARSKAQNLTALGILCCLLSISGFAEEEQEGLILSTPDQLAALTGEPHYLK